MIHDSDAEFHEPPKGEPMWAETNYFGFEVPEVPLHVGLYSLFRPNLGVVNSAVFVNSRKVTAGWEVDYWDHRAYLPLGGQKLTNFELNNGLKVVCKNPNQVWDIRFDKPGVLSIDVRFEALMPPFDIHDPVMDPRAKRSGADLSAGALWAGGHFDMTGKVTGEMTINGVTHKVDWMSTMDHSWGVRGEYQLGTMTWLQAHFSHDLAVHSMFQFDPTVPPGKPLALDLTHGYIMQNGAAVGLKEGTGITERSGLYPAKITLDLVDANDRKWHLEAESQTQFPCEYWPGSMSFMVLAKWAMNGKSGYGTSTDFYDYAHFTRLFVDTKPGR
jgi:hypothetical protein